MNNSWTCPHCNRPCTIRPYDTIVMSAHAPISEAHEYYLSEVSVVVCPNQECRKQTISVTITPCDSIGQKVGNPIISRQLLPESNAKLFPSYVPHPILDDYNEACLILSKSPKASATLSRRCLQGMVRDFWGIARGRLIDEINELQDKLDANTWNAIDSVRRVGNIGAHMEKDVNIIIDVDPEEAALLIWLIETLIKDWYVTKHEKDNRMSEIAQIAKKKTQQRSF